MFIFDRIATRGQYGLIATAGVLGILCAATAVEAGDDDAPQTLELTGTVRDFKERSVYGGHPDFERRPTAGYGLYCGNVAPYLSDDMKPVFTGTGRKITSQFKDSSGRPICYLLFDESKGDRIGSQGTSDPGGIASADSFNQWFRDVPNVNVSQDLTLTLIRQTDGSYLFDDKLDAKYKDLGGFFPIEDQLFGNPGGSPDRNFHFTFELHTEFTYDPSTSQTFKFIGDDDVWVYIDGKLVIDLGGVHGATQQYVDLSRLDLDAGKTYALDFFFAERHRTQSNFRVQTNLMLESVAPPALTAAFD